MPDLDAWLGSVAPLGEWRDDHDRAQDTLRTVMEKPSVITVYRFGVAQAAQTVRIDPVSAGAAQKLGYISVQPVPMVLITGVKGHPTLADVDLRIQDQFTSGGVNYAIKHIVPALPDRLVVLAEEL